MLSQYGFPKEIDNKVDLQLPQFVKSHSVKVTPSNTSSIVIPAQGASVRGTVGAAVPLAGTSQQIIFDLPMGIPGQFIDHRFTTLDMTVKYEVINAGVTTTTVANLRAGGHAWFDRLQLISQSGLVLEDTNMYGVVQEHINQTSLNNTDRDSLAMMYGFRAESALADNTNYVQGHTIPALTGANVAIAANTYSYSLPLLSGLIGSQARNFFDCRTNKLQLVMQTAAVVPVTLAVTADTDLNSRPPSVSFTISNISLNLAYVDIGLEGLKMLNKVSGLQYFTGKAWKVSTSTLPGGVSQYNSILCGLRGSSVNSIVTKCTESSVATTAGCVNGIYDSKAPIASSLSYSVNGVAVPANPINLTVNPATAFSRLQHCTPSFYNLDYKSCAVPSSYCVYLPGGALPSDTDQRFAIAGTATDPNTLAQFAFGFSLERIASGGLLSGENLNSSNTYFNINFSGSPTNSPTFIFIAKMDAIYILDPASGEVSVRL